MKILFAASEAAPFVKTGGLGDIAGTLPAALNKKGLDVRVILPLYKCIPERFKCEMEYITNIYIDISWRRQYCGIFRLVHDGVTFYFIDNKFYFDGDYPYDFIHLDMEKFVFFSKAVLSVLPTLDFRPDIIHCNDWQTGAVPVLLDTFRDNPFYVGIKTVMTIHNLKFQGRWGMEGIKDVMGISDYYFTPDKLEFYDDANLLKGGIVYADRITTVSNTYAEEITTSEYGEGLSELLYARRDSLTGIVNGISYTEWDPKNDSAIYENYTAADAFRKKKENKKKLQAELGLPVDGDKMMIGIVSRLTDQKGIDLIAYVMDKLCDGGCQIVVLGTGEESYEGLFKHYSWKYPDKVASLIYFSNDMAHKIYASCDAFLMPSRFEPCGLSQLVSMRYGTLPMVRETGGLKDTVIPYNEYTGEGNGFSFTYYNADDMLNVIRYAEDIFYNRKPEWEKLIKAAMKADFSWKASAAKYIAMYNELLGISEKKTPKKTGRTAAAAKKKASSGAGAKADMVSEAVRATHAEMGEKINSKSSFKKRLAFGMAVTEKLSNPGLLKIMDTAPFDEL